ncbi:MAG: TIGR04255 family protein [Deltaproteobacteria bacterium]|nr:TIGR04255 family protein [Deltaproteobacteria bacterium]
MRRNYPRPPIVEAVIDFRFAPTNSRTALLEALRSALGARYRGTDEQQELIELSAAVRPDTIATSAKRAVHVTFLRSDDSLRLIGCGDGMLSIHVLEPYPGWESFIEQADEAIGVLPETVANQPLRSVAVRYIDRIKLSDHGPSMEDILTIMPPRPEPMPKLLSGFHVTTHSRDPDGTLATLTLASAPREPGSDPSVVFDLTLLRAGEPLCGPFRSGAWRAIVDELHVRQREIFEASITDRARSLFQ